MDVKWKYIKELIHKEKIGVLCVHETKLVSLNVSKCFNIWGSNDISWVHRGIDREGVRIVTMWDNKIFNCDMSEEGNGFVLVVRDYKYGVFGQDVKVLIMNIYAPCSNKEKMIICREVEDKLASANCLIQCVIGDFNIKPFEKSGA